MHSNSVYEHIAAIAAVGSPDAVPADVQSADLESVDGAAAQRASRPAATIRGYFAVEAPVLSRALAEVCGPAQVVAFGRPRPDLSATARALAAFAGFPRHTDRAGHTDRDGRSGRSGVADALAERLIGTLNDELWFLGDAPAWIAPGVLIPLGADPDLAAALTEGEPLGDRLVDRLAVAQAIAEDRAGAAGLRTVRKGASKPAASGDPFEGLSVLNAGHAPAWRSMLRSVAHRYEQVDARDLQWLGLLGDVSGPGGLDRLVYGALASLSAVVDFADNGQEVLVGAAPATSSGPRL